MKDNLRGLVELDKKPECPRVWLSLTKSHALLKLLMFHCRFLWYGACSVHCAWKRLAMSHSDSYMIFQNSGGRRYAVADHAPLPFEMLQWTTFFQRGTIFSFQVICNLSRRSQFF